MVAALIRAGVPAERVAGEDGGFAVRIDESDMARAMAALEREGLPSARFQTMGEVFKKEGLLSSPTEERARLVYATSQELGRTISEIDGVLSARIHVVLPEESGRAGPAEGGSASVFIRHKAEADIEALIPDIKMLVTKSIANLPYDQVSVIHVSAPAPASVEDAPALERVMGVRVAEADAAGLRLMLGGLALLAALAIAGNAVWLWAWRAGRLSGISGALAGMAGPSIGAAAQAREPGRRPRRAA